MKLVEIGSFMAESTESAKKVATALINAGFEIVSQEGLPESFYVCLDVEKQ